MLLELSMIVRSLAKRSKESAVR